MIGKCRSIVHGKNALNYCLQKDKSEELFRCKLSGENADEISREFHGKQTSINLRSFSTFKRDS